MYIYTYTEVSLFNIVWTCQCSVNDNYIQSRRKPNIVNVINQSTLRQFVYNVEDNYLQLLKKLEKNEPKKQKIL